MCMFCVCGGVYVCVSIYFPNNYIFSIDKRVTKRYTEKKNTNHWSIKSVLKNIEIKSKV